jgi:hypothetical protein
MRAIGCNRIRRLGEGGREIAQRIGRDLAVMEKDKTVCDGKAMERR